MKYIYSVVLFVIFSSGVSLTRADEPLWRSIEIDKDAKYLIDEQSVLQDGYITNATLVIRPSKKQTVKDLIFGSASYAIQAQCINKVITPKHGVLHEDAYAQGNSTRQEALFYYHKIVPVSVDQKLIAHLCTN